jgi:hypothetical protein
MVLKNTTKIIGNYMVELGDNILMIKDLKDNLLKAEAVRPFEAEEKFKELCIKLESKIKERIALGLSV